MMSLEKKKRIIFEISVIINKGTGFLHAFYFGVPELRASNTAIAIRMLLLVVLEMISS